MVVEAMPPKQVQDADSATFHLGNGDVCRQMLFGGAADCGGKHVCAPCLTSCLLPPFLLSRCLPDMQCLAAGVAALASPLPPSAQLASAPLYWPGLTPLFQR